MRFCVCCDGCLTYIARRRSWRPSSADDVPVPIKEEATDDSGGYEGRFDNSKTDDRKREREREGERERD
jgi:hypothetical protein